MGIQNWADNIILVDLPAEPQIGDEIKALIDIVKSRGDCDVAIDFTDVDIITSSSISALLRLRKLLEDCCQKLIFCNVSPATKGVLTVTGIEEIFDIVDDKFIALASLQLVS